MIHLESLSLKRTLDEETKSVFPFSVPVIRAFEKLTFTSDVTFFVGENGSGKSTLMEAIAAAAGSIAIGESEISRDTTLNHARKLGAELRLSWARRTRKGFFLRAEDFFGFAKRMAQTRADLEAEKLDIELEFKHRSEKAQSLAKMAHTRELTALQSRYGSGLDAHSHGESFLELFQSRFVPDGFYLLDEPEAPLSPVRQLAMISLLKQMTEANAQFIIATHSPILMAFPNATILEFQSGGTVEVKKYDEVEHVALTKSFLNNPESYLRRL
jgi:predicted ATPase